MNLAAFKNLIELKDQLQIEFTNAFDAKAFNKFYMGIGIENPEKKAFNPRFNEQQKELTPQLDASKLQKYMTLIWMISALSKLPKSTSMYLEAKAELVTAFTQETLKQLPSGTPEMLQESEERVKAILDLLNKTAAELLTEYNYNKPSIAHIMPQQPAQIQEIGLDNDNYAPKPMAA